MSKKPISTFEREMQDKAFRKKFEKEYKEFLLSELILTLMQDGEKSVRKLAKEAGLSPRLIQNLRSGEQTDMKLKNFVKVSRACGYHIFLEKAGNRVEITEIV
jgi:predicted ArsR family transcriptional regulator